MKKRFLLLFPGLFLSFAPPLKQIAAIPGDIVTLTDDQVWINEASLLGSGTLANDSAGLPRVPFPRGTHRVLPGEYWLFATNLPQSFDSRYFGPVSESSILTSLVPVVTFNPKWLEE
jgi:conjugative transfer signal peptidase TraF